MAAGYHLGGICSTSGYLGIIEDRLGHVRFLVFYLVCGLAAALTQIYIIPASKIPMVGRVGLWRGSWEPI